MADSTPHPGASPSLIAALIPAFCEERFIERVVRGSREHVDQVWVVDDGSTDATASIARAAGAMVIPHPANRGKGAALKTGLRRLLELDVSAAILLDGDGQHLPEEIPRFLAALRESDAGVVVGNRLTDLRDMPLTRRWTNLYMSRRISRLCGCPIPDTQCGFRLLRRTVIPAVLGDSNRFDFETEMLLLAARAGWKIGSVPVSTIYGDEKSKIRPVADTIRFLRLMRKYEKLL